MFSKIIFSVASSSHKYGKEGRRDSSANNMSVNRGGVFFGFLFNVCFEKHLTNTGKKTNHPLWPQSQQPHTLSEGAENKGGKKKKTKKNTHCFQITALAFLKSCHQATFPGLLQH